MDTKKFDLDKFLLELEMDSAASAEEEFMEERYRECPHCGSETWDKLIYNKRGRVSRCSECEFDEEQ